MLDIIFIIVIGLALIAGLFTIGLTLFAIVRFIISSKSNSTNGVQVNGIIKKVNKLNSRDNRDNSIYDHHIELEVEFEYEGIINNKILRIYNEIDENKYKVGNKIECRYNTKTKELADELNLKGEENKKFFTAVIIGIIMFIYVIIFHNVDTTLNQAIMLILAAAFWYSSCFVFYDPYYSKDKGKYIKLKGHVVDYHVTYNLEDDYMWDYYCPEISFKYNNEKKKYLSSRQSSKKRYNIGQEVDVYYNPETDRIYEKGNNTFILIMMAIPPICALITLIQYLVK